MRGTQKINLPLAFEITTPLYHLLDRVREYTSGLYILVRNNLDLAELKKVMHSAFAWQETEFTNLCLLKKRDLKMASKTISCSQDIASDGAFCLDTTSMGLSGTGIGCFLDDTVHSLLGLKTDNFQTLYHFTIGRGYVDGRIQTQIAYKKKE